MRTLAATLILLLFQLPAYAQTVANGLIRYNSSLNKFQAYQNNAWFDLINTGGGSDNMGNHTATTAILSTLGTAGAPGYSFNGDTNTGIWNLGSDTLAFSTGGTERMRIMSTGYVGIGTTVAGTISGVTTPARLTVGDGTTIQQHMVVKGNNSATNILAGASNAASLHLQNTNNTNGNFTNVTFINASGNASSSIVGINTNHATVTGDLAFLVTPPSAGLTEVVRIANSQKVGIGTASPNARLDVYGTGVLSSILVPRDTTANRPSGVNGMIRYNTNTSKFEGYQGGAWVNIVSTGASQWTTSGSDIYYSNIGRVGINTTVPGRNFETVGRVFFTNHINGDPANNAMEFDLRSSQGSQGAPTQTLNGDHLGFIGGRGYVNGSGFANGSSAAIGFAAAEDFTSTSNMAARMEFYTRPTGGGRQERLRIDHNGYFIMGTGGAVVSVGALLDVIGTGQNYSSLRVPRDTTANRPATGLNGMIRYNTNNNKLEAFENGAWVNITTASDARLKKNVVEVSNGLEMVEKMKPVYFDWDFSNPHALGYQDRRQVGFIAQDLETVLPEVVNVGADTYRSVDYGKIVPVAIAGIKELNERQNYTDRVCSMTNQGLNPLSARMKANDRSVASMQSTIRTLEDENRRLRDLLEDMAERISKLERGSKK